MVKYPASVYVLFRVTLRMWIKRTGAFFIFGLLFNFSLPFRWKKTWSSCIQFWIEYEIAKENKRKRSWDKRYSLQEEGSSVLGRKIWGRKNNILSFHLLVWLVVQLKLAGYANLSNVYYKKKFVNWHVKFRKIWHWE